MHFHFYLPEGAVSLTEKQELDASLGNGSYLGKRGNFCIFWCNLKFLFVLSFLSHSLPGVMFFSNYPAILVFKAEKKKNCVSQDREGAEKKKYEFSHWKNLLAMQTFILIDKSRFCNQWGRKKQWKKKHWTKYVWQIDKLTNQNNHWREKKQCKLD